MLWEFVWDKNLVKKAHYGDAILSVNDIETDKMNICDLLIKESAFEKNQILQIVFRDSTGAKQSVELKKQLLKTHAKIVE